MTRRTTLNTAAAAVAGLALGSTQAAALGGDGRSTAADAPSGDSGRQARFPTTRVRRAAGADALGASVDFSFNYLSVGWTGVPRGGQVRFRGADGRLGAWQALSAGCAAGPDGATPAVRRADGTRPVQVLAAAPAGARGYELRVPDGATDVRAAVLDTAGGPARTVHVPAEPQWLLDVPYLTRAQWGADESLRFLPDGTENSPPAYYPAQVMTVHHTAGLNGDPDPAATVRAVYAQHAVVNDWGDIGYHFLVDEAGVIYEGRWSGTDGIAAHDAEGNLVTGFHTAGYNSGSLGVALLGTYDSATPTPEARASLTSVLAAYAKYHGFDARANVTFVNPVSGVTKDNPMLSGHRDWLSTECPGGVLHADLPRLREDVVRRQAYRRVRELPLPIRPRP
ncbi:MULTISPECIES: N-acetylmuramoyl-L-alanine amidase [Streptomyces]|uniref:N-acetylmuramoyl-L-alanine amidase n=1 Tax=Streptomyces TaxID=1883 RepID=UPI001E4B1296|nr:N-acetylmuramoyl-L-alanine amidase [Streptomyces ruber]